MNNKYIGTHREWSALDGFKIDCDGEMVLDRIETSASGSTDAIYICKECGFGHRINDLSFRDKVLSGELWKFKFTHAECTKGDKILGSGWCDGEMVLDKAKVVLIIPPPELGELFCGCPDATIIYRCNKCGFGYALPELVPCGIPVLPFDQTIPAEYIKERWGNIPIEFIEIKEK